ncbi:glycosyl transferase [Leptolyngbya sp. Heron Island J]|uniref:glycosyltransferase n=1 Tax=Leptolyngbya sp. Heron Island J TaxID=1385935 RepID=UPI0003B940D1|nr:glycosyltransferase [Leptolyngbya sp. Heron Island J]ESA37255.1 glycosyl transferase [Leptolyngbya sp. Heron Island J]
MIKPLVSVLINNYNYGRFLPDAIKSVFAQTYSNIEIIVVDDGSSDDSRDIIKQYDGKVISVLKENGGQASAFNEGFLKSKGEIILFLDSDDVFLANKVEKIVQVFSDNNEIDWCFHALKFVDKDLENLDSYASNVSSSDRSGVYDVRSHINKGNLRGKMPLDGTATSGLCFRRVLLSKMLPMPEEIRITSDDYLKYASFSSAPGYILLAELALQRIHGNNLYTLKKDDRKQFLKNKIEILTAYWLRKNFPSIRKYANNLFAISINNHKLLGEQDKQLGERIEGYQSMLNIFEKLELHLRSFYYHLTR